jgi:acetoacetyl-CoA synthetase
LTEGELLWKPDDRLVETANITDYMRWLAERGKRFEEYHTLWGWSVENIEEFWQTIWDYFSVDPHSRHKEVLSSRVMPGAEWFPGSKINYAAHVFREKRPGPALIARTESGEVRTLSWEELERSVGALASNLKEFGVKKGDRVAGYLPNGIEAATSFLACATIGAVWSSCPPEFGAHSVVDRFGQISPKILIAADGYTYGGKWHERTELVQSIAGSLKTVKRVVMVRRRRERQIKNEVDWEQAASGRERLRPEPFPSTHPLWILYSSGTTGLPKPIVQSQVGILLEHLKQHSLHNDIKLGDRFFWFTTTGWMMWNVVMGSLLQGATAVLYDGSASHPDMNALWDVVEDTGVKFMGISAAYVSACMKSGIRPIETHKLAKLVGLGSTGSPLSPEGFEWVYRNVKEDAWVASVSGGTDVCTPFVAGCVLLPVYSGEIQCRCLGAKVEAFDEAGRPMVGRVGELVLTEPMPSMPLYFWGDDDGRRYWESYFERYPGIWRHGDWIKITERGTCVIYGRSDATIKRMGVRIGTSEIYSVVESFPEVEDSLAVDFATPGGESKMILFIATKGNEKLGQELTERIRGRISADISPRHIPDVIMQAPAVPRTLNGKKLEVPVKRLLAGEDVSKSLNIGSLANPDSITFYSELSEKLRRDWKV